jgi:hypothetical protein
VGLFANKGISFRFPGDEIEVWSARNSQEFEIRFFNADRPTAEAVLQKMWPLGRIAFEGKHEFGAGRIQTLKFKAKTNKNEAILRGLEAIEKVGCAACHGNGCTRKCEPLIGEISTQSLRPYITELFGGQERGRP